MPRKNSPRRECGSSPAKNNRMKEWMYPTLATFFFWGLWGFTSKLTTDYINPRSAILFEALGGVIVGIVVLLVFDIRLEANAPGIGLAVLTGAFVFLGSLFFLFALTRGKVSIVIALTALYPLLTIALAMIFLGETLTLRQGIGVLLAVAAVILISL